MLIYHYTAASSIGGTLSWFLTPESQVSAHLVIDRVQKGDTDWTRAVQMVPYADKAWHAGKSEWLISEDLYQASRSMGYTWRLSRVGDQRKIVGVNSCSVGLELVGRGGSFTQLQMQTTAKLTTDLMMENDMLLLKKNCVGHEHVSPGRKIDPGGNFDWDKLWALVETYKEEPLKPVEPVATRPTITTVVHVVKKDHKIEAGKDKTNFFSKLRFWRWWS